jgi:hypothetical protein
MVARSILPSLATRAGAGGGRSRVIRTRPRTSIANTPTSARREGDAARVAASGHEDAFRRLGLSGRYMFG